MTSLPIPPWWLLSTTTASVCLYLSFWMEGGDGARENIERLIRMFVHVVLSFESNKKNPEVQSFSLWCTNCNTNQTDFRFNGSFALLGLLCNTISVVFHSHTLSWWKVQTNETHYKKRCFFAKKRNVNNFLSWKRFKLIKWNTILWSQSNI